ncbi:hypothetical protein AB0469_02270 [Streptomyces sp. NPDC093801]
MSALEAGRTELLHTAPVRYREQLLHLARREEPAAVDEEIVLPGRGGH